MVQGGAWLATAAGNRDWVHARRYAAALQSSKPLPVLDGLPVRLAPHETATLRTIATYERLYPALPTSQWGDRHSASIVATTDRLLVNHRLRGWISFWFTDLALYELTLDDSPWRIDIIWRNADEPLRLSGTTGPLLAVHVAAHTGGARWPQLPELRPLLDPKQQWGQR